MEKRGITLDFDDTVIPYLLHQHAKEQGARGLRRAAAQLTETPIANALLEKSVSAGDRIRISVQNDQIILEKDSDTKIRGF
jgi:ATP-dependent Clp protease ATP-binding subunit ClpA